MKAPEHLRKLKNWQDFEELCLRVWGAIWNKAEQIELNSTNEQGQKGVDIYCWVDEDGGYVGIQCKNIKDEKLNGDDNKIILKSIKNEIEKAEEFQPPLKRYIIATSAEKDGEIQEAVRIIDSERRAQGKFSVEIKFWDYITTKIDEHKSVHDWYMKDQNFKTNQKISLSFIDDSEEITLFPLFKKTFTTYQEKRNVTTLMEIASMANIHIPSKRFNLSFGRLQFKIKNTGELPIKNWKIKITIEGNYAEISDSNIANGSYYEIITLNKRNDISINDNTPQLIMYCLRPIDTLVGGDEYFFDDVFIKPNSSEENTTLAFNWELLSHDFRDNGKLVVNLNTKIKTVNKIEYVENYNRNNFPMEVSEVMEYTCSENEYNKLNDRNDKGFNN